MPTSHSMRDWSILTKPQIEAKIAEVERHLAALERLEKVLGPLRINYEAVRLELRDLRREYELDTDR